MDTKRQPNGGLVSFIEQGPRACVELREPFLMEWEKVTNIMHSGKLWEQSEDFTALPPHLFMLSSRDSYLVDCFSGFQWPSQIRGRLISHYIGNGGEG